MKSSGLVSSSLFLILNLTAACVPAPSTTETRVTGFETIGYPQKVAIFRGLEKNHKYDLSSCISRSLSSAVPNLDVVSPGEFRNLLAPLFEQKKPPEDENDLARLLTRPDLRARLQSSNITHLIFIRSELKVEEKGAGSCFQGCVGASSAKEQVHLVGVVWDVQNAAQPGTVQVESTGTTAVAAVLIPVGFIAFPEKAACDAFVENLKNSWLKHKN